MFLDKPEHDNQLQVYAFIRKIPLKKTIYDEILFLTNYMLINIYQLQLCVYPNKKA